MKKNSNNNSKIFLALAAVFLIVLCAAVAVTGYYSQGYKNWEKFKIAGEVEFEESESETVSTPRLMLSAGEAYTASDGVSINKTLTATVLPADAVNKAVDWTATWSEDATRASEPVSNYLTVTPAADGATTATVACFQSFEGDQIIITVSTRVGGFSAYCIAEYAGIPDSLVIDVTGYTKVKDTAWNTELIEMLCNTTNYLPINLDNTLHQVGESFVPNYKITMEAHGSIIVKNDVYDTSGNLTGTKNINRSMIVSDTWDINQNCYTMFHSEGGNHIHVSASIENGQLKVEAKDAITAYFAVVGGRGGRGEFSFNGYVDNKIPYTTITVTEQTTGVSMSVNVRTIATITSVALSTETLTF